MGLVANTELGFEENTMVKNTDVSIDLINEESLVIKELDGRVYFETLPLMSVVPAHGPLNALFPVIDKPAITGIRG